MDTYYENMIKSGVKHNSMFEPNTVNCKSTKEELEEFYKDTEDLTPKVKKLVPNAMKIYDVSCRNNKKKSLIIISED